MKKRIGFLALASAALFLVACGGAGSMNDSSTIVESSSQTETTDLLQQVQDAGVIKVGLMGTYQPYNFLNENQEMDGFDADIAKEIAKGLDVDIEFVSQEFSGMIAGLKANKFDMVVSQMTITEDRKKEMLFSDPYITNQVKVIVSETNTDILSVNDFPGKQIGVGLGTNDETYLRTVLMPEVGEFEIRTYDDVITSLKDLDAGRIDATINNMYALKPVIETNGFKIKAVGDAVKSDQAGIAVTLGNEAFISEVNRILAEIKEDGTYRDIFVKWFGEEPPAE
jgi:cystine transport system substrate-binding protein